MCGALAAAKRNPQHVMVHLECFSEPVGPVVCQTFGTLFVTRVQTSKLLVHGAYVGVVGT